MQKNNTYNKRIILRTIFLFILLILVTSSIPLKTSGSASHPSRASTSNDIIPEWYSEVIYKGTKAVDGCAIGDCYPGHTGNEIIYCSREFDLWMGYRDGNKWTTVKLWQGSGQPLTPAIGNFDPDHEGNEIIVVGMKSGLEDDGGEGEAVEVYWNATTKQWDTKVIFTNTMMLHGVAIGDIDPRNDGDEVVVVGFAYRATLLKKVNHTWVSELMWQDNNNVRKAVIDEFDSDHEGKELVVVSKSGKCTMIYWNGTQWINRVLWTDTEDGLARVAVGDCDQDLDGKEIVVGSDSGKVYLIRGSGDSWDSTLLFTDIDKNRGVWIGDVDPNQPGNEIIAYGYSHNVTEIYGSADDWESKTIWTDSARGHEVRIGEFDSNHKGNEILVVGYSNNATMVAYNYADFEIAPDEDTKQITSGGQVVFQINVTSIEGFDRNVSFTPIQGIEIIKSYSFDPQSLKPFGSVFLTINIYPTSKSDEIGLTVIGEGGGITHSTLLTLDVIGDTFSPTVDELIKPDNRQNVPINTTIEFLFSEDMNRTSVESSFSIIPTVSGNFTWENNRKFIFTLNENLSYNTSYEIKIGQHSLDLAGNSIGYDMIFTITTENAPKDDDEGDDCNAILLPILTLVIIAALLVIGFSAKKDKLKEELEKESGEVKKIKTINKEPVADKPKVKRSKIKKSSKRKKPKIKKKPVE
jgi:hypothetical protein